MARDNDAYARAQAVVQQELKAQPIRKTMDAAERAFNQTYDRCDDRLADDPAARALLKRYKPVGFFTSYSARRRDPKSGRTVPFTKLSPATAQEAERQHIEQRADRREWHVRRKRLN